MIAIGTPKSGRSPSVACSAIEIGRPRPHAVLVDAQEGAEARRRRAFLGRPGAIDAGDSRQEGLDDLGDRGLLAPYRVARLARRPLMGLFAAAHPITLGTLNRPATRAASGAFASASSRRREGCGTSGRRAEAIELDVRGRLDAGRVDGADLLHVGQDVGELAPQAAALVLGERQPGELGDAHDVTV